MSRPAWFEVWEPKTYQQKSLMACPLREIFVGGDRGAGKTEALIGHWMQYACDHKAAAIGVLFYKQFRRIEAVQHRMQALFPQLGAFYDRSHASWTFPNRARIRLRHVFNVEDTFMFSGHNYAWMAFDDVEEWDDDMPIRRMLPCLRSINAPSRLLLAGRDGDAAPPWLRNRYLDHGPYRIVMDQETLVTRVYIPASQEARS